jgi:hypothetical protein
MTRSVFTVGSSSLIALAWMGLTTTSHAQTCDELKGIDYSQGEMYAISGRNETRTIVRLGPSLAATELNFDPTIKLLYVLDAPLAQSGIFSIPRDFAGVLAVRLVSTSATGRKSSRSPSIVYLRRDSVVTHRRIRDSWTGDVGASEYFNYHNPRELRASSSRLEKKFHTEYTYKDGSQIDRPMNLQNVVNNFISQKWRPLSPPVDRVDS